MLDGGACTACGDVAVPVRVLSVDGRRAEVADRRGRRAEVALDFAPDARPGDLLLVHAGVAIGRPGERP